MDIRIDDFELNNFLNEIYETFGVSVTDKNIINIVDVTNTITKEIRSMYNMDMNSKVYIINIKDISDMNLVAIDNLYEYDNSYIMFYDKKFMGEEMYGWYKYTIH